MIDALEKSRVPKRQKDKPLRMPILACHKISGKGFVLIGRVDSGEISSTDMLIKVGATLDISALTREIAPPTVKFTKNNRYDH